MLNEILEKSEEEISQIQKGINSIKENGLFPFDLKISDIKIEENYFIDLSSLKNSIIQLEYIKKSSKLLLKDFINKNKSLNEKTINILVEKNIIEGKKINSYNVVELELENWVFVFRTTDFILLCAYKAEDPNVTIHMDTLMIKTKDYSFSYNISNSKNLNLNRYNIKCLKTNNSYVYLNNHYYCRKERLKKEVDFKVLNEEALIEYSFPKYKPEFQPFFYDIKSDSIYNLLKIKVNRSLFNILLINEDIAKFYLDEKTNKIKNLMLQFGYNVLSSNSDLSNPPKTLGMSRTNERRDVERENMDKYLKEMGVKVYGKSNSFFVVDVNTFNTELINEMEDYFNLIYKC